MTKAIEGEPILTSDGEAVAAFWAVSIELLSGFMHFIPAINREKIMTYDNAAVPVYDPMDRCTIWHSVTMPDGRSYWRISTDAPYEWWRNCPWFRQAPATPGPSAAGMVAAYDLVATDLELRGCPPNEMHRLDYVRGYWKQRAKLPQN